MIDVPGGRSLLGWLLVVAALIALFMEPNVGVLVAVAAAVLWYLRSGAGEEDEVAPVSRDAPAGTDLPLSAEGGLALRWAEAPSGSGFVVVDAASGERASPDRLDGSEGIFGVEVASGPHRGGALQDAAFDPGREVRLVPEPDNPVDADAVAVWSLDESRQAGYLPEGAIEKRDIAMLLHEDVELRAFVRWQELDDRDRRRGLDLLVLEPDTGFAGID